MTHNDLVAWLVTYDIKDKRRGAKVLKAMKRLGVPLQYSVFLVRASAVTMSRTMDDLNRLIDRRADDVRAYRIPVSVEWHTLGRSKLPCGVVVDVASPERRVPVRVQRTHAVDQSVAEYTG